MKAEIITLTPELAKEFLNNNIGNRDLKPIKNHYASQMKSGGWKENGEPIIIDVNGTIKDGQHRLHAVIEANYTYKCALISGVDPNVMDTIDTGTNRSLPDVLKFNGFNCCPLISGIIKSVLKHKNNTVALNRSGRDRWSVTNSIGLDYANKHKEGLRKIAKEASSLYKRQGVVLLTASHIAFFLHTLAESFEYGATHIEFMKGIMGITADSSSCTHYVYRKLLHATSNKTTLKPMYKFNLIIKAWNIYAKEDYPVSRMSVPIDKHETVV